MCRGPWSRSGTEQVGQAWARCWRRVVLAALFGVATAATAQDTPAAADATEAVTPAVQVTLAGFTFAPELTEDGEPVLDENGAPVILRVPLADSVVTPGDQVEYVITLDNPTDEPALDVALGAQVAGELLLDPFSFTGPDGLDIAWADDEAPDNFRPLFEEIDGETVMTADLDALRILRLTLPALAPTAQYSIAYTVTLR